jgi:DNA-binding NtrC family response regulator
MNPPAAESEHASNSRQAHILVADDDPAVRLLLTLMLERLGYRVTTVIDGSIAVEVVAANPRDIDAVILDIHMPELNGVAAMARIRSLAPHVRVVLTSGTPKVDVITNFAPQPPWLFLEKPFHYNELSAIFPQVAK